MKATPEDNTSPHAAAEAKKTEISQPAAKRSAASRLGTYLGNLLISAGNKLKNRSYQVKLQRNRTQRHIDVIKII